MLKFYLSEPGNNYKHKSEHELFLFGSPQFALIKSYVVVAKAQDSDDEQIDKV